MSHAHAPHSSSTEFSIHIKAVGQGKGCPPELRCPKPLHLDFPATYYDLEDTGGPSQTPWVGTVELEEWYHDLYSSGFIDTEVEPPIHPGYRVAPVGQLQMIVKTPTNAIKAFLVPYDLREIPIGGRLLARERTFVHNLNPETPTSGSSPGPRTSPNIAYGSPDKGKKKESLRYAYQLQFICIADSTKPKRESSTTRQTSISSSSSTSTSSINSDGKAYYLSKSLRIVFTSTPPESDQETRTEREDEIVPVSDINSTGSGRRRSSVALGPPGKERMRVMEDWDIVRRKWYARREMEIGEEMSNQSESALEMEEEEEEEEETALPPPRPPSRTSTPVPQPFNIPNTHTPLPSPRFQRRQLRRTSAEERELSEKLRKMALE